MSYNNTKTPIKPTDEAKWQVPMRPRANGGSMEYCLEGELKERFCKLFPKHTNRRLMQWFGIPFSTLQRFKREFGLEKDMKAICKEHARDVKKICQKNGYYDSLRGHAPSEACLEATRRMRAEGFHPMKQLRKNNPRKYRKTLERRSEQRKKLYRKEYLRMMYGLERKTKLNIKVNPLPRKAIAHKYAMIHSCNYFADQDNPDWICYDSETNRSAKREATAVRHGLKVIQADEDK